MIYILKIPKKEDNKNEYINKYKNKNKNNNKERTKTSKSISLPSKLTEVESESPPSVIFEHVKQLHNIRRYTNRRKKKQKITK